MFHFAKLDGCEIKVIAPVPYCPPWRFLGKRYQQSQIKKFEVMDGIEVYHPRFPLIPKLSMPVHGLSLFLSSLNLVKRIHQDFPFDIIDGHYVYPDGFAAVLLGKALKKPVVLSARGSDINQFIGFRTIKPIIRHALEHADRVISVCDALKREMVKLGINSHKITVIPNGVDTQKFFPEQRSIARKTLSLPNHNQIILSVGTLIPRKGFHVLLDAMPIILKEIPQTHLYLVGEGAYRSYIEQKIAQMSLNRHVTLVGERPNSELRIWYSAADVFCLASSREGWANVIMESLACGTPVVATNVWGAPEILTSPDFGILVERNPESIAAGLIEALNRQLDRNQIREHIAEQTWDLVAREVHAIFGSCLRSYEDGNPDTRHSNSLCCADGCRQLKNQ